MRISAKRIVRHIIEVLLLALLSYAIIIYADDYREQRQNGGQGDIGGEGQNKVFDLWYSYTSYKPYLEEAAARYEKQTGVKVRLTYYTTIDYMDKISSASAAGNGPDLFLMSEENLQNAVLLGIAERNYNEELMNEDNYAKKALEAVTYMDNIYGYPMGFETAVFAVNKAYADEMPKTFDDVKAFADNFNSGEDTDGHDYSQVSAVLRWDISNVMYSYGFLGAYLNVGGELGDNPEIIDINGENAVKAGQYYNSLAQYFYTDAESAEYENVMNDFMQGKIIYTIASADIIERLADGSVEAELSPLPDLTSQLKTRALSGTDIIMVNPFADMKEEAVEFAEYLSYGMSEEMFGLCGIIAAKSAEYENPYIGTFVSAYEQSSGMPKLMTTYDYWIKVNNVLKNIWSGEDAAQQLEGLYTELQERIN